METTATATEKVETWAIVELMGHTRLVGRVGESQLCPGLLRVDVLDEAGEFQYTKHIGSSAIYAISEIGANEAKAIAKSFSHEPSFAYQVKHRLLNANENNEDFSEDYDD